MRNSSFVPNRGVYEFDLMPGEAMRVEFGFDAANEQQVKVEYKQFGATYPIAHVWSKRPFEPATHGNRTAEVQRVVVSSFRFVSMQGNVANRGKVTAEAATACDIGWEDATDNDYNDAKAEIRLV